MDSVGYKIQFEVVSSIRANRRMVDRDELLKKKKKCYAEQGCSHCNTFDLYSGCARLDLQQADINCSRAYVALLNPSREVPEYNFRLGHDHFFSQTFLFIIH